MALTNSQYDLIMRRYNDIQLLQRHAQEERIREACEKLPRLAEINAEVSAAALSEARRRLSGQEAGNGPSLDEKLTDLAEERRALLLSAGYPEDYLELRYNCPLCRDTGYVGGRKCVCFQKEAIRILCEQSNLSQIPGETDFSRFSIEYYPEGMINPVSRLSARQEAEKALRQANAFVRNFFDEPGRNLYFYGDVGVGKTFLSCCIGRELLKQGASVLYLSAIDLFELLGQETFSGEDSTDFRDTVFDCDLLIVDDLGTELTNSFVSSRLFLCVNERILRGRSTILSTNLSLEKFADTFSERTFSRIMGAYDLIHLSGKDIRIQKKIAGGQ